MIQTPYSELVRKGSSKGETYFRLNYIESLFENQAIRRVEIDITKLRSDKADKLMRSLMTRFTTRREVRKRFLRPDKVILIVEITRY